MAGLRRRDDSNMTRTVLDMEVEGARPKGRTKLRYMDTIKRDIKKNGLTNVNILDRNDWRMAVSTDVEEPTTVDKESCRVLLPRKHALE